MPQQGLDIHKLGPGVEEVGGVNMAQFVGADTGWPFALAKTASVRFRSFSQNPNTAPKASGKGTSRSLSPLPTRTDLAVPSTRRTSDAL